MTYDQTIKNLLSDPNQLLKKAPFTRGSRVAFLRPTVSSANIGDLVTPTLPRVERTIVSQSQYMLELDPNSHKVLYDTNIPSITMKLNDGGYAEIEYKKMAVPWQRIIKDKQVLHLCGNKMQFTQLDSTPTEQQKKDFTTFKQYWDLRNQDGMRTKMVDAQKSFGDAGLLFYFDREGRVKSRLLSYKDGFVLCPHNDDNGDRLLECVYYKSDGIIYLDCYDDTYMYRFTQGEVNEIADESGWVRKEPVRHGFSEIPLVTKRGDVAWDKVQNIIEVYEVIYNIFLVIQKRHGWGILYIKGQFSDEGKRIAGAIILNDKTIDGDGSAEFKTPPTPDGMLDTLELMEETIQKGSGCTFLLPKDVNISSDISGTAIQLTQSLDNETAMQGAIDWQNVADKMCRLFKVGLAKELVGQGIQPTAVTDFQNLHVAAAFKPWKPRSDSEYNNMLMSLKNSGLLSVKTGIQKNTESTPDEEARIAQENAEAAAAAAADKTNTDTDDSE